MAEQLRVFVSHSHQDNDFCQQIVQALRDAGADVWYDEHNMSSGRLGRTIVRELRARPVFVVILSSDALGSQWVEDETRWAYGLLCKDPSRLMLPITAAILQEDDIWLFLQDFKRIEAPGCTPYSVEDAASRLVRALGLTPRGEAPAPVAPQPSEDGDDLLTRGRALYAQKQYAEALPLFERATHLDSKSFDAWANLSFVLYELGRSNEAMAAFENAVAVYNAHDATTWNIKGRMFISLGDWHEALAAFDQAIALNPTDASFWSEKGRMLIHLERYAEALVAFDQALALNAHYVSVWFKKGIVLDRLKRYEEALVAFDRTVALEPFYHEGWIAKASTLRTLGRTAEADAVEAAEKRATELALKG